jgi:hypothetical protein
MRSKVVELLSGWLAGGFLPRKLRDASSAAAAVAGVSHKAGGGF